MRGAQLFFSGKAFDLDAVQCFLLVAKARVNREPAAGVPGVLHEDVEVFLRRFAATIEVRASHAVKPAIHRIGPDADRRAGRRRPAIGGDKSRARELIAVRILNGIVRQTILNLVIADEVRRFDRPLVVEAAIARFVEADAARGPLGRDRRIGRPPYVVRGDLIDPVQRARVRPFDQPVVSQDAVVADCLIVSTVVDFAERRRAGRAQRRSALRPHLAM